MMKATRRARTLLAPVMLAFVACAVSEVVTRAAMIVASSFGEGVLVIADLYSVFAREGFVAGGAEVVDAHGRFKYAITNMVTTTCLSVEALSVIAFVKTRRCLRSPLLPQV